MLLLSETKLKGKDKCEFGRVSGKSWVWSNVGHMNVWGSY